MTMIRQKRDEREPNSLAKGVFSVGVAIFSAFHSMKTWTDTHLSAVNTEFGPESVLVALDKKNYGRALHRSKPSASVYINAVDSLFVPPANLINWWIYSYWPPAIFKFVYKGAMNRILLIAGTNWTYLPE